MKIKRWILAGEVPESDTTEELLQDAGRCLDKVNSFEIVGSILFEGEDGKYYVGEVEFVISEANPDYVKMCLEEEQEMLEEEVE